MSQPKKGFLPRIEVWIILVFFGSFILWAVSQCNDTKQRYEEVADLDLEEDAEDEAVATDTLANPATNSPTANAAPTSPTTTTPTPARANQENRTRLYVTIDKLKLRKGPSLDSAVLIELPLFSQVEFMDEITDSTQQINLGTEIADEPWVKVRHKRGFEGWVYGAGVHYHKIKRKGVQ